MRDLSEDGGAISVRGCRLEPSHRDAGSPTGSSVHLRRGSGERPTCSSQLFTGGRYDRGTQSDTHTGLLRPSAWVPLAWIDQAMHTASSRGRGACDLRYAQRTLNRAADSRGLRPRVPEHHSPTTQLSMRLKAGAHRARYGCRRHAWAVCSVAGASFAHSTHQISRTLKCARVLSPLDQEEIELARARRDATALPRPRPSQHEPAACGGGRRGDRPRRRRDPGRSDCCDDFTVWGQVSPASV